MTRRIFKYEVPVNDKTTAFDLNGEVLHVAVRDGGFVEYIEFWAERDLAKAPQRRNFQVFGTGHRLPENAVWRGTTARTPEGLVWHLYELLDGAHG